MIVWPDSWSAKEKWGPCGVEVCAFRINLDWAGTLALLRTFEKAGAKQLYRLATRCVLHGPPSREDFDQVVVGAFDDQAR